MWLQVSFGMHPHNFRPPHHHRIPLFIYFFLSVVPTSTPFLPPLLRFSASCRHSNSPLALHPWLHGYPSGIGCYQQPSVA